MTISLCMIVKNEEAVLARCLESVVLFADEIIIVDTGSIDKTKQIASNYTDKVYDFEWIDDFSCARNFSFSKATKDYIMWLDADDVIENEELKKLLELKKTKEDVDIYMLLYNIAFDKYSNPTFSYYRERIVRNNKTFFWVDPVHEVIIPHGIIKKIDIGISHKKIKESDPKRNLKIYNNLLSSGKELSSRQRFYYSRELMYNGLYSEAISSFLLFLKRKDAWVENKIEACQNLSFCYNKINDIESALNSLFISFTFDTPRAEILCELGNTLLQLNRYNEAIYWYKLATKCKLNFESGAFVLKDCYDFVPYLQLCICYYKLGEINKAKYYNNQAGKIKPLDNAVLYNENFFKSLKNKR